MTNLHHDLKIPSSDLNTSALARHELVLSVVMEQESQIRKIGQNNVDMRDDLKSLLDRVGGSQKANLMEPGTLLDGLTDIMLSVQSLKLQQDDQVRQAQSQQAEHNMELMQAIQALGTILLNPQSSQSVCLNSRTRPAIRAQGTVRHLSLREGMRLGQLLASWYVFVTFVPTLLTLIDFKLMGTLYYAPRIIQQIHVSVLPLDVFGASLRIFDQQMPQSSLVSIISHCLTISASSSVTAIRRHNTV